MKTLNLVLLVISSFGPLKAMSATRSMASVRNANRVVHARELMGTGYKKSMFEGSKDIENTIFTVVKDKLPKAYKARANSIAKTIIEEAYKNQLDPYFVMAVISGESSFNPLAVGPVGEIGMMQIRPTTGEWMSKIVKSKFKGESTLRDPVENIKLGTAYLAWLRSKFEGHGQLYLAAYNMGPKSVKKAVSKNVFPKDYPIHVMKRYIAFYKDIGRKKATL
jgi:soluble lytic murein transglycosylase